MNIAALVSGGVDSSVTIPLLKKMGYEPTIFYIQIGMDDKPGFDCPAEEDIEITTWIAKKYGLKLELVSLQDEYWETVVKYTIDTVQKGLTPNPDIMCNRLIKFGAFEEKYGKHFDKITTGHYANILETENGNFLATAEDKVKDQTYFLSQITEQQVSKIMFPIGHIPKPEVRQIAEEMRLPSAHRPDSQGICFLGKVNYNDFIRRFVGEKPGAIINIDNGKRLGTHKGIWFHTIGQRRGLGLGGGPWFVVKKDIENNIIYVSNGYDPIAQYNDKVHLGEMNWINPNFDIENLSKVKFKIRHQPEFTAGELVKDGDNYYIKSDNKVSGVAPGQFGVIYNDEETICYGGGVITDPEYHV
ncbi:MAG: tRNA 2-thiouridine(34) synthase MnmA [Hyphomicrobiales bacterium]